MDKTKKLYIICIIIIAIILFCGGYELGVMIKKQKPKTTEKSNDITEVKYSSDIEIVPTLFDTVYFNTAWTPTFELVWQDMKNVLVGKDNELTFTPNLEIVNNLNKEYFNESDINPDYLYKKYGLKTLLLKKEIEDAIMAKFNQKSDILDKLKWDEDNLNDPDNPDVNRYIFYSMLYKKFEYEYVFDILDNDKFKESDNIKYFGVKTSTDVRVRNQLQVLFYDDKDNFAIKIFTKDNEEIILYKNPYGTNFNDMYNSLELKSKNYKGSRRLEFIDTFKMPYLKFDVLKQYTELIGGSFKTINGEAEIADALQTVKFEINEKGGEIKSEAVIDVVETSSAKPIEEPEPRYFELNNTFALFIKEANKSKPFVAVRIDDITKFQ